MVRRATPPPRDWLAEGDFPAAALRSGAPVEAARARRLAAALGSALGIDGRTVVEVAEAAGVARSTVYAVLSGAVYADTVSLARLEAELGVALWGHP